MEKSELIIWDVIRSQINQLKLGSTITRKDLIENLKWKIESDHVQFKNRSKKVFSNITVDCYRNQLEKTGYLSKTTKRGEFFKDKDIPEYYTSYDLRADYEIYVFNSIKKYLLSLKTQKSNEI